PSGLQCSSEIYSVKDIQSSANLSPPSEPPLHSRRLAQARASSITAFETEQGAAADNAGRVGAPGGAGLLARARAPRDPHPLTALGSRKLGAITPAPLVPVKGASQAPWRLPALQPLARGET